MKIKQRLSALGFTSDDGEGTEGIRQNSYYYDPNGYQVELVQYTTNNIQKRCDC